MHSMPYEDRRVFVGHARHAEPFRDTLDRGAPGVPCPYFLGQGPHPDVLELDPARVARRPIRPRGLTRPGAAGLSPIAGACRVRRDWPSRCAVVVTTVTSRPLAMISIWFHCPSGLATCLSAAATSKIRAGRFLRAERRIQRPVVGVVDNLNLHSRIRRVAFHGREWRRRCWHGCRRTCGSPGAARNP